MKKILFLSVISLLVLSGCDFSKTETLSCTYENTTANIKTEVNYGIDHENDEIKKLRITYNYININNQGVQDGIGTGTDGTTNDTIPDEDGIIDGVVGETLNDLIRNMSDVILDVAGLKDRHMKVQSNYNGINGFSVQNVTDVDDNYKVTYIVDYDSITDEDLTRLNLSRSLLTQRDNYISQGFTCK